MKKKRVYWPYTYPLGLIKPAPGWSWYRESNPGQHSQDSTYHGLGYTSRGALAGTRNSSMGSPRSIDPTTHRTTSERSYRRATSRSLLFIHSDYSIKYLIHLHFLIKTVYSRYAGLERGTCVVRDTYSMRGILHIPAPGVVCIASRGS